MKVIITYYLDVVKKVSHLSINIKPKSNILCNIRKITMKLSLQENHEIETNF